MTHLHVFVLVSDDATLNQKTRNSLALLAHLPLDISWLDNIATLESLTTSAEYCLIMPAGDHLTPSYLDAFFLLPDPLRYAYQPQFSYLFAKRGHIFYRRNTDICPIAEEINALLLSPHHARHIIFPSEQLKPILYSRPPAAQNLFWHMAQYLATQNITLITLADCISIEYQNVPELVKAENMVEHLYPQVSLAFDKEGLLSNQNFSDLYGNPQ